MVSPSLAIIPSPFSSSIFSVLSFFSSSLSPPKLLFTKPSGSFVSTINPRLAFITAASNSALLYLPNFFIGAIIPAKRGTPLLCPILSGSKICKIFLLPKELKAGYPVTFV